MDENHDYTEENKRMLKSFLKEVISPSVIVVIVIMLILGYLFGEY